MAAAQVVVDPDVVARGQEKPDGVTADVAGPPVTRMRMQNLTTDSQFVMPLVMPMKTSSKSISSSLSIFRRKPP